MKTKINKEGRHSMNASLNTGPPAGRPPGHQTGRAHQQRKQQQEIIETYKARKQAYFYGLNRSNVTHIFFLFTTLTEGHSMLPFLNQQ
jgi:hypothetical protein